jgi:hypothetical protein
VHVSVGRNTTRTDIVREKEARFQSHSVSQDTIFLPAGAFGAYEAVAARLAAAKPGMDLPLLTCRSRKCGEQSMEWSTNR